MLYVGTSGFQYKHWNDGVFYPSGVKDRLAFLSQRMNALEINASFYSIPKPGSVRRWSEKLPQNFKLTLKAPRSVTHRRRLKLRSDPTIKQGWDLLRYFSEGVLQIAPQQRGPVLVQLEHRFKIDLDRLEAVLEFFRVLQLTVALEVRCTSWLRMETLRLLREYRGALVSADWRECTVPIYDTGSFVYVRRHGSLGRYFGSYSRAKLQADLDAVAPYLEQGRDVYVFFNNDGGGAAPRNAVSMLKLADVRFV